MALPWSAAIIKKLMMIFPNRYDFTLAATFDAMAVEWSKGLDGYSKKEIKLGLQKCREETSAPNLGEFKILCRPPKHKSNSMAYRQHYLRRKKTRRGDSIANLAAMRLMNLKLGKPTKDYDDETEDKIQAYYDRTGKRDAVAEMFGDRDIKKTK